MKRCLLILLVMISIVAQDIPAAETTVNGRIFAQWRLDKTNGADNYNDFSLGRSYLTAKSKLSENTSARLTIDLRETTDADGRNRYDMILKYGYFDWKPAFANGITTLRFGLQPTQYIDVQNGLWGRRYLEKTISDKNSYMTSSDLGASLAFDLSDGGKLGQIIGAVFNGTSYSSLEENNKHKDLNVVGVLTPLSDDPDLNRTTIIAQFYHGVQNVTVADTVSASDYKRQLVSVGGLFGYRELLDAGIDLNWYTLGSGPGGADVTMTGYSFHGTLFLAELAEDAPALRTLDLFGRVDINDPNTDTDNDGDTHFILGVECAPVKGFKASLNYRTTSYEDDAVESEKTINLNTLVKF